MPDHSAFLLDPNLFENLKSAFLDRYPDFKDFTEPGDGFIKEEIAYKERCLETFQGQRDSFDQALHRGMPKRLWV